MLRILIASLVVTLMLLPVPAAGPASAFDGRPTPVQPAETYSTDELVSAGHEFFGQTSSGLAAALSELFAQFGLPNGYVLGEEASGAIFGGLRYGEGALQVVGAAPQPVFWQGPSVGWDFGGSGSRVMMLVYNLRTEQDLMQRFTGVDGSAYLVGGVSMTVMAGNQTFIVPVRTGVGARLGVSLGYLKFTPEPTWNPF
ncbi:MAG: DUF1134 domain-containing protein [Pseudomonadota bacterium]